MLNSRQKYLLQGFLIGPDPGFFLEGRIRGFLEGRIQIRIRVKPSRTQSPEFPLEAVIGDFLIILDITFIVI